MFNKKLKKMKHGIVWILLFCFLMNPLSALAAEEVQEEAIPATEEESAEDVPTTEEGPAEDVLATASLTENEAVKERSKVIFDVSEIAKNNGTDATCVTEDDATYGNILKEAGLTDAMLSMTSGNVLFRFVEADGRDLSAYETDGCVYFKIWSGESQDIVSTLEISSSENNDKEELQKAGIVLKPGWNNVVAKISSASKVGGTIDLTKVIRLRFFSLERTVPNFLLSDVYVGLTAYAPGNTTGSAQGDVETAANAIKANLSKDASEAYTREVRIAKNYSQEEILAKIISDLESDVTFYLKDVDNIYNVVTNITCTSKECATISVQMDEVTENISVNITLTEYEKSQIKLVTPVYGTEKNVVASIVIGEGEYQVDKTGREDATAVIQNALNDCAAAGGGVVWLPVGYYRITDMLYVPTYVALQGDYQDPDTVTDPSNLHYGTILLAEVNESTPLIYVGGVAGVEGLTIYYPDQTLDQVKEYQYAIYNEGAELHAEDQCLHTIKNCTILNGYKGVGLCDALYSDGGKSAQTYVYNVKGTFLKTGFYNYNASDNGNTVGFTAKADYWVNFMSSPAYEEIKQNLNITDTTVTKEKIDNCTRNGGIGLHIGDLEGDYFSDITIENFAHGIQIDSGIRTTYYGDLYNLDVSGCKVGIQINKLSGFGVNIASSKFHDNTLDIENNTSVQVKLADVAYTTMKGTTTYTTSDDTYTDKISGYLTPAYGTTKSSLYIFSYDKSSELSLSKQLQALLDKAGTEGGGIVYVPAGHYVLEEAICVPANTELQGCGGTMMRPSQQIEGGTVFEVYFGKNSTDTVKDAAIVLNGENAGVRKVIIAFPEQTPNTPLATGFGIAGKNAKKAYVSDSCIAGFSHGIYMENCDDYVITGITFANLLNNVTAKDCVGGYISSCLQNVTPIGRNTYGFTAWAEMQSGTTTPTFTYTSTYLDCIILDNCADAMVYNWYAYRPHDTIVLKNDAKVTALNYGSGGARGDDAGVLITAETAGCEALSVNSHQKNRYTVEAVKGANVRAYNRMTLHESTLVSVEDNYRSTGAEEWILLEPGVSLLSEKANSDGYDLSGGGTVSCGLNYEEYSDSYDFSDYSVMAVTLADTSTADETSYILKLNEKTASFAVKKSGAQTIYLSMDAFGEDLTDVKIATFSLKVDAAVSKSVVSKISLLKKLPEGAKLTETGNGIKQRMNIVTTETGTMKCTYTDARKTNFEVVSGEALPEGTSAASVWKLTSQQPNVCIDFSAVDISEYKDDGYIHFYMYLPKTAVDANPTLQFELTSSGKADANELQYKFGKGNEFYNVTFKEGWNEIWLPIAGGHSTNYIDFTKVNFIRIFSNKKSDSQQTFYLDGFEVVHQNAVTEGIVNNQDDYVLWEKESDLTKDNVLSENAKFIELADYGKDGVGIFNQASEAGTYNYVRYTIKNPQHIADYSSGYLHVSLYIENEEDLKNLGKLRMELTSNGKPDAREFQWNMNDAAAQMEAGWNELYFPLMKSYANMNSGAYLDLNRANYFRLFFEANTAPVGMIFADMYATMTVPESSDTGSIILCGNTKKTQAAPTVTGNYEESADGKTYTYTLQKIDAAEYCMDDGAWQDSPVFENLLPESRHTFYVRMKGNVNYKTGEIAALEITLPKLSEKKDEGNIGNEDNAQNNGNTENKEPELVETAPYVPTTTPSQSSGAGTGDASANALIYAVAAFCCSVMFATAYGLRRKKKF